MKTTQRFLLFLLIISFQIASCSRESGELPILPLTSDLWIDQLPDSLYFKEINGLYFNENLYVLDAAYDQVFGFNPDGGFLQAIGKKGRGPTELYQVGQLFVDHDTLTVYSHGKGAFQRFYKGNFLDEIKLPTEIGRFIGYPFFIKEGMLYFYPFDERGSLGSFPVNQPDHYRIAGELEHFEATREKLFKNARMLFAHNQTIISVPTSLNFIERYGQSGDLIERYDLEKLTIFRKRAEYIQSLQLAQNQVAAMLRDAFVFEDKLYLLVYNQDGEKSSVNRVVRFCLKGQQLKPDAIYDLGGLSGSFLAASASHLWVVVINRDNYGIARLPIPEE